MKHAQNYLTLFLKGLAIGSADIIPGISGGTIAFVIGIYEKLLAAIQSLNATALRLLCAGKFQALWQHLHGAFLLPLVMGIGISLFTTARLVTYLLGYHPIQSWASFGGLILASSVIIYQKIKQWDFLTLFFSLCGAVLAYILTKAAPVLTPDARWFIALTGAIAVCAMVLPGISGSFLLLLLGKYRFMLDALENFNLGILATFAGGGVVGLFTFSRLIAWLLHRFYNYTVAALAGFMLGSFNKLWPWKQLVGQPETGGGSTVQLIYNLSPCKFQEVLGQDPLIGQALLCMSLGALLVIGIEKATRSK